MTLLLVAPLSVSIAAVAVAAWRIVCCGTWRDFAVLGAFGAVLLVGAFIAGAVA